MVVNRPRPGGAIGGDRFTTAVRIMQVMRDGVDAQGLWFRCPRTASNPPVRLPRLHRCLEDPDHGRAEGTSGPCIIGPAALRVSPRRDEEKMLERSGPLSPVSQDASAMPRQCGACTACCTVMQVSEVQNPAGCRCFHQRDHGCVIYDSRPDGCRGFTCLWLADSKGRFGPEHRPDHFGLVLADDADEAGPGPSIAAREVWAGAAAQPRAFHLLSLLSRFMSVRVIPAPPGQAVRLTLNGAAVGVENAGGEDGRESLDAA